MRWPTKWMPAVALIGLAAVLPAAGIHFVGHLIARVPRVNANPWPRAGRVWHRAGGRVFAGRPKGVKKTTAPAPAVLPLPPSQLAVGITTVTAVRDVARSGLLLAALVLAGAVRAEDPPLPAAVAQVAHGTITRAALEAPIRFLSSDLLEGRGPASRGDQLARLYLQTRLEGMGYQPAFANGAWQQPFDIIGIKGQFPKSWSFEGRSERVDLAWREDYIAASGVQSESVSIDDAELVFVGYGIQAPEFHWDDFKGMNLTGKILVMMNNDSDWDLSPPTGSMAAGTSTA